MCLGSPDFQFSPSDLKCPTITYVQPINRNSINKAQIRFNVKLLKPFPFFFFLFPLFLFSFRSQVKRPRCMKGMTTFNLEIVLFTIKSKFTWSLTGNFWNFFMALIYFNLCANNVSHRPIQQWRYHVGWPTDTILFIHSYTFPLIFCLWVL